MTYESRKIDELRKRLDNGQRVDRKELREAFKETEKVVRTLRKTIKDVRNVQTAIRRNNRRLLLDLKLGGELTKTLDELAADIEKSAKAGDEAREGEFRRRIKRRDKEAQERILNLESRTKRKDRIRERMQEIYDLLKDLEK